MDIISINGNMQGLGWIKGKYISWKGEYSCCKWRDL